MHSKKSAFLERSIKNGMAVENSDISDTCNDGIGAFFLYYLETDPSRTKMVGRTTGINRKKQWEM